MDQLSEAIGLHQRQLFPQAEALYKQLLADGHQDPNIHQYLVECLLQQQKVTDALEIVEKGLELTPEKPELLYLSSQIYWGTNQRSKALVNYEKFAAQNPDNVDVLFTLGTMYFDEKRLDDAVRVFEQITVLQPNQAAAYFYLGMVQIDQSKYEEARENLRAGLIYEPNSSFGNKQLGMTLHVSGEFDESLKHYEIALANAKSDMEKLESIVLLGNVHRDLNNTEEAKSYYNKALELDPNNVQAKSNLSKLSTRTVASWHFNMLADTQRNVAYDQAITAATKPGMNVLDIGAGSGLLSMMAARAGATNITAVELVPELAEVAKMIISDNKFDEQITVYEKRSTALTVGVEMPEKADMVVSEILDAGLLGESVIPSLRHAWSNLLKKDAICIPKAADVYATLIQCDDFHRTLHIKEVQGFNLSAFNRFKEERPYVVNHVEQVKSRNLSESFPVLSVDFYNLPPLASPDNANEHPLEVTITESGKVQGVMFWFTLHLDDSLQMSSGPNGEMVHWGQAIQLFDEERDVKAGDILQLTALQSDSLIFFRIND
ncbi:MAG: tetratricopeptide repeat protein [bacterium]|nr:tetratricopeptide repeat protein [bacterium]